MWLEKSAGDGSGRVFKAVGRTFVFIPRASGTQRRACGLAEEVRGKGQRGVICFVFYVESCPPKRYTEVLIRIPHTVTYL